MVTILDTPRLPSTDAMRAALPHARELAQLLYAATEQLPGDPELARQTLVALGKVVLTLREDASPWHLAGPVFDHLTRARAAAGEVA
jgi:hypothetical protein